MTNDAKFRIARIASSLLLALSVLGIGYTFMKPTEPSQPTRGASEESLPPGAFAEVVIDALNQLNTKNIPPCIGDDVTKTMGISEDIDIDGAHLESKEPPCSYCVGTLFEVYIKAFQEARDRGFPSYASKGFTGNDFYEFRRKFYGTDGNKRTLVRALCESGFAEEVRDIDDARQGDFIQFWRHNGTGHSVIFLDAVHDSKGRIAGIKFWSSQGRTSGYGVNEEYFGDAKENIDDDQIYIARAIQY